MTAYEEALAPLVDLIAARVVAAVRAELRKTAPASTDRSLTKAEVAALLSVKENTLMLKVQTGTVPPPYTVRGEQPRWSERTIEKYMSGEWGSQK